MSGSELGIDEALVGSVVGERYLVNGVLGTGTAGTALTVEHLHIGRPAVMKVLRSRYVPLEQVLRVFHGEARAAWMITHPSLAEIVDVGTLPDGAPFVVMEYLEGETLAARISRDRLSIAAAVDVMMQLLSAVDALHTRNLLVRDLRPQNVFLAHRRGCRPLAKILDLGLSRLLPLESVQEEWDGLRAASAAHGARAQNTDAQDTAARSALAAPYYWSPERIRSEHTLAFTSDLFVLSAIFYEMLTGHPPFNATSFNGLLLQISEGRPAPPSELRSDLPPALDALLVRALSSTSKLRPSSARDLQDEIRAAFEGVRRHPSSQAMPIARTADPKAARSASHLSRPPPAIASSSPPPPMAPPRPGELYDDETRTDRNVPEHVTSDPPPDAGAPLPESAPRTKTAPVAFEALGTVDALRADPHDEPPTFQGMAAVATVDALRRRSADDEETETMNLTPELRARIDQLTKKA